MFKNYYKIALRNLAKNKTISLINIIGLAIGLAAVILILSYINNELSFDKFHDKGNRIYRGIIKTTTDQGIETGPQMIAAVGPSLSEEFPEIEKMVRFREPENKFLTYKDNSFYTNNLLYADSTLFDVFSFRLLTGNPKTALAAPYSIVLSVGTANKIFGKEDPIGKMITLDNKDLLTVTGIAEDAPSNSHIQYNAFISFTSLYEDKNMYLDWNGGWAYYTYILLHPNVDIRSLDNKFTNFMDKHLNYMYEGSSWHSILFFQPLHRIYFYSRMNGEIGPTGDLSYLILFGLIALLIFVIACINFINLTTARLTGRLRETGARKIMGASRINIVLQFLTESIIMNLIAFLLALILVESTIPILNNLLGQNLVLYQSSTFHYTLTILIILIITGILAGNYPALYLSSFKAIDSVKNTIPARLRKINLRKITVLLQYTISISMIISTLFLYRQLYYIRHKEPGFDRKNTLVVPLSSEKVREKKDLLKSDFLNIPAVQFIAACSDYPGRGLTKNGYIAEGQKEFVLINVLDGDEDIVDVLGLKIMKGRNFSKSFSTDKTRYLINETYACELKWVDPAGKYIERNGRHEVVGVVSDFNFASLHENIAPLIITIKPEGEYAYFLIKSKPLQMQEVVDQIKELWNKLLPDLPFDYFYLDEAYHKVYASEQNLSKLLLLFTALAIFIAFLGLFGLSSFETTRQTKSIGIRKTNGAKTWQIMYILSKDFTIWVVIAFIIACPLAYFVMNKWLQDFAYRTNLSWWVFIVSGAFAMIVAMFTVGWQSWRAASRNPVEALRYE